MTLEAKEAPKRDEDWKQAATKERDQAEAFSKAPPLEVGGRFLTGLRAWAMRTLQVEQAPARVEQHQVFDDADKNKVIGIKVLWVGGPVSVIPSEALAGLRAIAEVAGWNLAAVGSVQMEGQDPNAPGAVIVVRLDMLPEVAMEVPKRQEAKLAAAAGSTNPIKA